MPSALPEFVEPMLAKLGRPFDSDEHWFEVKWDGIRALSFVEGGDYRLLSRRRMDQKARYPELSFLAGLEPGTVLDGEIVALDGGKPSFEAVLRREQARGELRIQNLVRSVPITYVVFDVLYLGHRSLMKEPFRRRREVLEELVEGCDDPTLVLTEGLASNGLAFFEQLKAMELEGMVAKHVESSYLPGKRTDAWTKMKPRKKLQCAIVGYQRDDSGDLKSVIVASLDQASGELRCVGKVGSGLGEKLRGALLERLAERPCEAPLVDCELEGEWVEPGLYCVVSYMEWTNAGNLRAPVFLELIDGA